MRAVNARLFFRIEAMNATLATKKKHPSGHVGGHRGAKTKEKPAKLPHVRAREAVAKMPPARAAVEPWLPYEHLDGSRAAALGEVARFLGVSAGGWAASATAGATQKVTDRNLSAAVPNAGALVAAVRAAGFDDDALEGGGAFACAADAAAKATPAGKAGRARQKPP